MIDEEYKSQQAEIVTKAVETALSYLPVIEAAISIVSTVDVLTALATAAALSPGEYVRPNILPMGSGVIKLKVMYSSYELLLIV